MSMLWQEVESSIRYDPGLRITYVTITADRQLCLTPSSMRYTLAAMG